MKILFSLIILGFVHMAAAQDYLFPEPTDPNFCQVVQKYISNTDKESYNKVMRTMEDYRASKPMVRPLQSYQIMSYSGQTPIMVSCKVKGSAHLRGQYGEDAAGEQQFCPSVTRELQAQAIRELRAEGNSQAADAAAALILDDTEPFITGQEYLTEFELSYVGEDGATHLRSNGLFHDYDSWTSWILPERVEGQVYCHIPTAAYMKALARGEMEPGAALMVTTEEAIIAPE
ncbi:MAG: hypothetical protein OEU86_05245 [Gammaproteobacteria bacterium]|nr:hypothetical protein [Gammaproteobacteria bacterium]